MKKIITVIIIILIILFVIYLLISRNSLVEFTSVHIEIQDAPESVQNLIKYNNEDILMCKVKENSEMQYYLYIPSIKVDNGYKSYETVNIKPIGRDGIDIIVDHHVRSTPNQILIKILIIKPEIKYIKLNNETFDIKKIQEVPIR